MSLERRFKFTEKRLSELSNYPVRNKVRFYDTEVKGLVVIKHKSGTVTYAVYKKPKGAKRAVTVDMGTVGSIPLTQAREQARNHIVTMSQGHNPNLLFREQNQDGLTLQKALDEFCVLRESKTAPNTLQQYQRALQNYSPLLLKKKIKDITFDDVMEVHRKITHGQCSWTQADGNRYTMKKPSPSQADLWGRAMRAIINYAMDNWRGADRRQLIPENPVKALSINRLWNKVPPKKTRIHEYELERFFETLALFRSQSGRLPSEIAISYALEVALFTGLREMEVLSATKEQVDLENGLLYVAKTKNKAPLTLPLVPHVEAIFRARIEVVPDDCIFLFPSADCKQHIVSVDKTIANLVALSAINGQEALALNFHDMRRSFASIAEACYIGKYMIKRLMNHSSGGNGDVTGDYMHFSDEEVLKKSIKIEQYILEQGHQLDSSDSERLNEELARVLGELDDGSKRNWLALMTK
ncbi:tyrosine-type recombinase/integrase [Vibrio alginolyticus]|nr:tyrosine-type recombinase/integrase [Vibrio alginolyticus]